MDKNNPFQPYLDFYRTISPQTVHQIRELCTENVLFKDPFNEVRSSHLYEKILTHMYEQVDHPAFDILDTALSGETCFIKWRFSFRKGGNANEIVGMSEVKVNAEGKIYSHVDYWDSGEYVYGRVPLLGTIIGWIRAKLAVKD